MAENSYYTKEQMQRALNFINERLSLQRSSIKDIQNALKIAAEKIVSISLKYNISPELFKFSSNQRLSFEVSEVLNDLLEELTQIVANYSEYKVEEKNHYYITTTMLNEKYKGATLKDRLRIYVDKFSSEIEPIIAAAFLIGFSRNKTIANIKNNITDLRKSSLAKVAIENRIYSASNFNESMGSGFTKSSYGNIERVSIDYIARIRQKIYIEEEKNNYGTNAWYVMRGSSYPCDLCDSEVGVHNSDFELPPYHPRCCCLAIPIKLI